MTSPSSAASWPGRRTSTTSAPSARSIAACSRKLPWTARTPMRGARSMSKSLRVAGPAIGAAAALDPAPPFGGLEERCLEPPIEAGAPLATGAPLGSIPSDACEGDRRVDTRHDREDLRQVSQLEQAPNRPCSHLVDHDRQPEVALVRSSPGGEQRGDARRAEEGRLTQVDDEVQPLFERGGELAR